MSIITIKVLRTISKIVLLIVGIGIIGYGGLMVYKSVVNKPQRVRITNVTDSAATITWVTDNPVRGVVYYKDEGSFLPGPLGVLGSKVAYDDRDFALAQDDCVKAFNENAKNTKDEDFAVDGNNFDCENIPVEKLGAYYTHSVTIKDLEDSSTYFFVVGNGIWSWSVDGVDKEINENDIAVTNSFNFKTSQLLDEVPTPNIAYGTVYAGVKSEEGYLSESLSKDSLVFAYLTINGVNSQIISAVTNTDGGWIFDKSNFRDAEGNLIVDLNGAIMMVCAQYEDVAEAKCENVSDGLEGDTELDVQGNNLEDLDIGTKNRILERFEQLVSKVYAVGPNTPCPSPLPNITDDSTYTCDKDCESNWSVSGCGVGSSCMKKCTHITKTKYGTWESTDWVKFGTVPGTCNVPGVCGECSNGDFEDNKQTCKYKICQAGNWSAWKDGLHDGSACSPAGTGSNDCDSDEIGDCDGNKKCKLVNGYRKWVADASCAASNDCDSDEIGDCDGNKKCKLVNGYRKWVTDASCGATNDCDSDEIGDCDGNKKCKLVNGYRKWVADASCGATNDCDSDEIGDCDGNKKCKLVNGYRKWVADSSCDVSANVGGSNGNPAKPTEICTVVPKYKGECAGNIGGEKELYECVVNCTVLSGNKKTSKTITSTECQNGYRNIPISTSCSLPETLRGVKVVVTEVDLLSIPLEVAKVVLHPVDVGATFLVKKVQELGDALTLSSCLIDEVAKSAAWEKLCTAIGGQTKKEELEETCPDGKLNKMKYTCILNSESAFQDKSSSPSSLISKAYAEDSVSNGNTIYLPEYGMYSFELGDYTLLTENVDGDVSYIFYIEANEKAGFQMPKDSEKPTEEEDIVIRSDAIEIQHKKVASAQAYTLNEGINLISFNFIPVSTKLGSLTAKGVIDEATKKGVTIQYISSFDGGRWSKGYTCKDGKCSGNDFNILPGKGYLVYVIEGGDMSIGGYELKSSVPVNLSGGWNLVGIHGYTTAYTARTLIDSMSKIDGVTANNVTWWPTSKGMYEGLQVTEGQEYGFDFPISPTNGYFVRISSFKPEDSKCKSLLWNEGGTLNGACGITK